MHKQENPSEWTPSTPDEYAGQGGSYVYDPETGKRRPVLPEDQAPLAKPED